MGSADTAIDLHREGVERYQGGEGDAAFALLREAARDTDVELLTDFGVVSRSVAGPAAASAVLQTCALVHGSTPELREDIRLLEAERSQGFSAALLAEVIAGLTRPPLSDTVDTLRHPDGAPGISLDGLPVSLAHLLTSHEHEWLYTRLDPASRALMAKLLAFRLLGHRRVPLPLTGARHRELVEQARSCMVEEKTGDLGFLGHRDRYDLTPLGYPIVADVHVLNVQHCFLLEQYRHDPVAVRPGDVVVDGGGCWGETALYFAHLAGPGGRVISFEFEPGNLELLERNLERNPELAARIEIERRAIWSASDEALSFQSNGPGTRVGAGAMAGASVLTRAIDDLAVDRVDFIKLDVEGAETAALRGAEQTIRRCRPRIAAAVYHRPEDWIDLPAFLDGLELGYRFALGHFTMHAEETILYAWCEPEE